MADEGSSLFYDDDESCEKHLSESEEDGEKYTLAPIGKIVLVLSLVFVFLSDFCRVICSDDVPPAFPCCRAFVRAHSKMCPLHYLIF